MISSWKTILEAEFKQDYFQEIISKLKTERENYTVYPPVKDVFNAFNYCQLEDTKCVILGQDCYHQANQAHGLSFSVRNGIKIPPSLRNIHKELKNDLGIDPPSHGSLVSWAKQGVLLLNSALTVREGEPGSHMDIWEPFTDRIMKVLDSVDRPLVFILWGNFARSKGMLLKSELHHSIISAHPSPFSAYNGFFGSKPFSRTNAFLRANNIPEIDWRIS